MATTISLSRFRNICFFLLMGCAYLALKSLALAQEADWDRVIDENYRALVSVSIDTKVALDGLGAGQSYGTGVIIDAKRGWVVTSQLITRLGKFSRAEIKFYNGQTTLVKMLYYDPWCGFALLAFDTHQIQFPIAQVTLGSANQVSIGDHLLSISLLWSERSPLFRMGRVDDIHTLTYSMSRSRNSEHFYISSDMKTVSGGSPTFNSTGEMVGMHDFSNNNNAGEDSFQLYADYIIDALAAFEKGVLPVRGDAGILFGSIIIQSAKENFEYPESAIERDADGKSLFNRLIKVGALLPDSEAANLLYPGDLLIEAAGGVPDQPFSPVGESLYALEKLFNQNVGKRVRLRIFRDGKTQEVSIPIVDAQANKIDRYVQFGEATFHEMTPTLRARHNISEGGVIISQIQPTSMLTGVGSFPILIELHGKPTRNLDDLITAVQSLDGITRTNVLVCDLNNSYTQPYCEYVDVDLQRSPLQVFRWDSTSHDWKIETVK